MWVAKSAPPPTYSPPTKPDLAAPGDLKVRGAGLVINQCGSSGWVGWLFPGWWVRLVLVIGVFADINNSGV